MARWMTGTEVSERYSIGAQRLLEYSRRGDLPCYWTDSGEVMFDADTVALLFVPRSAELRRTGPDLGTLGQLRLGPDLQEDAAAAPPKRRRPPARQSSLASPSTPKKTRRVA